MNNRLPKLIIFVFFVFLTFVVRSIPLINSDFFRVWQAWFPLAYWGVGLISGYIVFYLDRIVDVYFANPDMELSVYARKYFREKEYIKGWRLIMHNKKLQMRLTFRSALFHCVWMALAIFTVTSTNNLFGIGFVLGIGVHLLLDVWDDYLYNPKQLHQWLFWQINRSFNDKQLRTYVWFSSLMTLGIVLLSL